MKVIAAAGRETFLVEMSVGEIARAAGYANSGDSAWRSAIGGHELRIGTVIDCNAAYNYHYRVTSFQKEASSAANTLRALADLIGGALPDIVIPPVEEKTEGGEK